MVSPLLRLKAYAQPLILLSISPGVLPHHIAHPPFSNYHLAFEIQVEMVSRISGKSSAPRYDHFGLACIGILDSNDLIRRWRRHLTKSTTSNLSCREHKVPALSLVRDQVISPITSKQIRSRRCTVRSRIHSCMRSLSPKRRRLD